MARLLTTGYETGDVLEVGSTVSGGVNETVTVVTATPTPRLGGAYCLKCATATTVSAPVANKLFTLSTSYTDLWVRFGAYFNLPSAVEAVLVGFYDSAGGNQNCVTYSNTDNQFRVRAGVASNGSLLATSSTTGGYAQGTWHLVEIRWTATSTTSGTTEVWVNGTRIINFTGDNVATANVNVGRVALGVVAGGGTWAAGNYIGIDDIAINDTSGSFNNGRPGDGRVVYLVPSGAGSSTALTRGGTDTGANYSQVSEVPPSMTQYVYSATTTTRDLYAITDAPAATISIAVVELVALAQNNDTGAGSLGLTLKSGATTNEATAQALSSGPAYYRARYETDPATSAAWTLSALQAIEAGVTVR